MSLIAFIFFLALQHGALYGQNSFQLRPGDTLSLPSGEDGIFKLEPLYGKWIQTDLLLPLCYRIGRRMSGKILSVDSLGPGTHFFTFTRLEQDTICNLLPVYQDLPGIWQVTVGRDTSFLGYCEELLGLPFVLPPRYIPGFGHQTDLRLAADCAEVPIYARRRQGYRLPYGGPRGIERYLKPTANLKPGVILHFGHQVSVFYEDRGVLGVLDGPDLLLHAYDKKVEIISLEQTDLLHRRFRILWWK